MKSLDLADDKFVSATKSPTAYAEALQKLRQTRSRCLIAVYCGVFTLALSYWMNDGGLHKEPIWLGVIIAGGILATNANAQIKMLKLFYDHKHEDEA